MKKKPFLIITYVWGLHIKIYNDYLINCKTLQRKWMTIVRNKTSDRIVYIYIGEVGIQTIKITNRKRLLKKLATQINIIYTYEYPSYANSHKKWVSWLEPENWCHKQGNCKLHGYPYQYVLPR